MAFTLVELLVVIAIIGMLVGLLLPAMGAARESGRRTTCTNNMRNLALAVHGHLATREAFPPASQFRVGGKYSKFSPPDPARHSMITFLLPYFEQGNVYDGFDMRFDWNDSKYSRNETNARQDLGGVLICPSAPAGRTDKHVSDYNAATRIDPRTDGGVGALIRSGRVASRVPETNSDDFGNWSSAWDGVMQRYSVDHTPNCRSRCEDRRVVRRAHVKDGLSNTFMLFESAGKPNCYTRGKFDSECTSRGDITRFRWASSSLYMVINDVCDDGRMLNCNNNSQPYAFHSNGANFALADASVRFVEQSVDADVFVAMFTLAAGDIGSLD